MRKRYRQTMTFVLDVWAEDKEQATVLNADHYFYFPHEWEPDKTEIVAEDDCTFGPINEEM